MTTKVLAFFTVLCVMSVIIGAIGTLENHLKNEYWHSQLVFESGPEELIVLDTHNWTPVTVTIYHPVREQCDEDPDVLASGLKIQVYKAGEYRYCAVSRDFLKRYGGQYRWGDIIVLEGAGEFDGPWRIEDTMHPRWKNRIDLLVTPGAPLRKYTEVLMRRA